MSRDICTASSRGVDGPPRSRTVLLATLAVTVTCCVACADDGEIADAPVDASTSTSVAAGRSAATTTTSDVTTSRVTATAIDTTAAPPTPTTAPVDDGKLRHPAGVEIDLPDGWSEAGASIATEFGLGAECRSARIVDREPPPDAGDAEGAQILQSIVQICARPTDAATLEDFMLATYGGTDDFGRIRIGEIAAYRSSGSARASVIFTIHGQFAIQILTSVVADPTLESQRTQQVEQIVDSIRLI